MGGASRHGVGRRRRSSGSAAATTQAAAGPRRERHGERHRHGTRDQRQRRPAAAATVARSSRETGSAGASVVSAQSTRSTLPPASSARGGCRRARAQRRLREDSPGLGHRARSRPGQDARGTAPRRPRAAAAGRTRRGRTAPALASPAGSARGREGAPRPPGGRTAAAVSHRRPRARPGPPSRAPDRRQGLPADLSSSSAGTTITATVRPVRADEPGLARARVVAPGVDARCRPSPALRGTGPHGRGVLADAAGEDHGVEAPSTA